VVAVIIGVYIEHLFINVLCGLVFVHDTQHVTGNAGITRVTGEATHH
jgi:hypothetical protein